MSTVSVFLDCRSAGWFDLPAGPAAASVIVGDDPQSSTADFVVTAASTGAGLVLYERRRQPASQGQRRYQIDITAFVRRQTQFPASKKTLMAQAVGRRSRRILDATGGWGYDSLALCAQGYNVTILERDWLLAGFLREAMQRLAASDWARRHAVVVPEVAFVDAVTYLSSQAVDADCIYLDPMFPPKRKASALAKKEMQVLHDWLPPQTDSDALFTAAWQTASRRIVVKRPNYSDSLGQAIGVKPSQQLSSKLLRYDVYLRGE